MRHALTASLLLAGLVQSGFATGQYLTTGQNGFSVNPTIAFNGDATGYGAQLGYSFGGRVDILADYVRHQVSSEDDGNDIEYGGNSFGAGLMAHPLKEGGSLPVSLSLLAGYTHTTYSGGDLEGEVFGEKYETEITGNIYSFGAILHRSLAVSPVFSVLVGAGYNWQWIFSEFESTGQEAEENDEGHHAFPFLLEGIVNLNGGAKVVVSTSYLLGEEDEDDVEDNVIGIGLNYVMPLN